MTDLQFLFLNGMIGFIGYRACVLCGMSPGQSFLAGWVGAGIVFLFFVRRPIRDDDDDNGGGRPGEAAP